MNSLNSNNKAIWFLTIILLNCLILSCLERKDKELDTVKFNLNNRSQELFNEIENRDNADKNENFIEELNVFKNDIIDYSEVALEKGFIRNNDSVLIYIDKTIATLKEEIVNDETDITDGVWTSNYQISQSYIDAGIYNTDTNIIFRQDGSLIVFEGGSVSSCETEGDYIVDDMDRTLTISGLQNFNCPWLSLLNGSYSWSNDLSEKYKNIDNGIEFYYYRRIKFN